MSWRSTLWVLQLCCLVLLLASVDSGAQEADSQLAVVRARIQRLESTLSELERASATTEQQRESLDAELALAEARVRELELTLTASRDEIEVIRGEATELAEELKARRTILKGHLEMLALLGRPGPLQLLYDAGRGGDLEASVSTITALTSAQLHLIEEYEELQRERGSRLAELSRLIESARAEAAELERRRAELGEVRARVENELARLQRRQRSTGNALSEMRERAAALERLLGVVRSRRSFAGREDIRGYRGALPWPAEGVVRESFGKHYLPKYSTYTVCNGLRLEVASGAEVTAVFPGEVAYARHFKGYGNMVVLDHGQGVYSLVAGLAAIHVRLDQRVEMGTRLGVASPPADNGNIYFEIRVGERAQDPRRWLQLEEG